MLNNMLMKVTILGTLVFIVFLIEFHVVMVLLPGGHGAQLCCARARQGWTARV
jgi:hypothetical protein